MNIQEFNDWYADYCAAFPGTKEFVAKGGNAKATLGFWLQILEPFSLDAAKTVTMRMLAGHDDPVEITDRAQIPRRVAELCQRYNDRQRLEQLPPAPREPRVEQAAQWDTGKILSALIDCAKQGGDTEALAKRLMPINPEREPRRRCLTCRDSGLVTVWHPHSMDLAKRGELRLPGCGSLGGCYRAAIRCDCQTGARYDHLAWGPTDKKTGRPYRSTPIIYDPKRWRICKGFKQTDLEDLCEFMANIKPAGFVDAFAEYNASSAV